MADLRDAEMEEGDRLPMFAGVGGTKVQAQAGVCVQWEVSTRQRRQIGIIW